MASRFLAIVVIATLISCTFAATNETTVTLVAPGGSQQVDLVAFDNVYIRSASNVAFTLTFSASDELDLDLDDISVQVPSNAVYYISRALWCGNDVADNAAGTLTVSYTYNGGAGNSFVIGVVPSGSVVLGGRKSAPATFERFLCVSPSTPEEYRDIYLSVADVEDESHFRASVRTNDGQRVSDVYAEDGSCPGTDCPQEDDFNDDKCEFAARSEGSSAKHDINSLWSPEGRWWFRARLASCSEGAPISVGLEFSNAFAAKASAALIAVLAAVAMLL